MEYIEREPCVDTRSINLKTQLLMYFRWLAIFLAQKKINLWVKEHKYWNARALNHWLLWQSHFNLHFILLIQCFLIMLCTALPNFISYFLLDIWVSNCLLSVFTVKCFLWARIHLATQVQSSKKEYRAAFLPQTFITCKSLEESQFRRDAPPCLTNTLSTD